jgi:hypothetical protein
MNREEFHLFDTSIRLLDPFKTNSDSGNGKENPLFLRVILAVRAYPSKASPPVAAELVWRQRRYFTLAWGVALGFQSCPETSAEGAIQFLARCPRLRMNDALLALSTAVHLNSFEPSLRSHSAEDNC